MKYSMDQIKLAMTDSGHFTQQETLWVAKQFKEVTGGMVQSGDKFDKDQIKQALSKLNKKPSKIADVLSQLKKNESIRESIESGKSTEEIVNSLTESADVMAVKKELENLLKRSDNFHVFMGRDNKEVAVQPAWEGGDETEDPATMVSYDSKTGEIALPYPTKYTSPDKPNDPKAIAKQMVDIITNPKWFIDPPSNLKQGI